jgi:hypothetical protein
MCGCCRGEATGWNHLVGGLATHLHVVWHLTRLSLEHRGSVSKHLRPGETTLSRLLFCSDCGWGLWLSGLLLLRVSPPLSNGSTVTLGLYGPHLAVTPHQDLRLTGRRTSGGDVFWLWWLARIHTVSGHTPVVFPVPTESVSVGEVLTRASDPGRGPTHFWMPMRLKLPTVLLPKVENQHVRIDIPRAGICHHLSRPVLSCTHPPIEELHHLRAQLIEQFDVVQLSTAAVTTDRFSTRPRVTGLDHFLIAVGTMDG